MAWTFRSSLLGELIHCMFCYYFPASPSSERLLQKNMLEIIRFYADRYITCQICVVMFAVSTKVPKVLPIPPIPPPTRPKPTSRPLKWLRHQSDSDCGVPGNELSDVTMNDGANCRGQCAGMKDCTHYAWTEKPKGTCWFKVWDAAQRKSC